MDDLIKQAETHYNELQKKEQELTNQLKLVKDEQKPYRAMLREAGLLNKVTRKRKKDIPTDHRHES